jgi:hypothetical protein
MKALCALARKKLKRVSVPGHVDGPAADLDAHMETGIWIPRTWRLLCAMEAFAAAQEGGAEGATFRTYCETMPTPPINPRQISLQESRPVESNRKMREERMFAVSTGVDDSGRVYMGAHARVTASGKPPAPRMYFYDDVRGQTGRVHVGYIGKHLTILATKNT